MRIRAITAGHRQRPDINRRAIERAGAFVQDAKAAFERAGHEVQTLRLATQPLSELVRGLFAPQAVTVAQRMEEAAAAGGIDYVSLGPVLAAQRQGPDPLIDALPDILAKTQRVFLSVLAATTKDGVNMAAVHQAARALVRIGGLDDDGAAARRFALSANVPPHGPFFPSAYHRGRRPGFALALEAADLAVEAFRGAKDVASASKALQASLERHGRRLATIARRMEQRHGLQFHGLDISLAPFPEEARSIGKAIEKLGVSRFGDHGTLFAAAVVTDVLRQARLPKAGFSGLMIPLLEDATMAERHAEGAFDIRSLLLYSAVCGTGLDTVPIPGDATAGEIAAVYLDLCALSVVLNKPLTARLMPMQGKRAGDQVSFAFPFFAPTTVARMRGRTGGALTTTTHWTPRH